MSFCQNLLHFTLGQWSESWRLWCRVSFSLVFLSFKNSSPREKVGKLSSFWDWWAFLCLYLLLSQNIIFCPALTMAARAIKNFWLSDLLTPSARECTIEIYIITQVILALWLVRAYDLLEDRRTIDAIIKKFFPSVVLKWWKVLRIRIIFYVTGQKIRYKKVLPRHWTGSRSQKTKDKAVSFRKWYRNNFLAASVGSRARLNHAQTWSW